MSLVEKMEWWIARDNADSPHVDASDYFEEVGDFDENAIDQAQLSSYSRAILDSSAYSWLIENILKQACQHWDEFQPRIMLRTRQEILKQLPAGRISKKRVPDSYSAVFHIPIQALQSRMRADSYSDSYTPTTRRLVSETTVSTCSSHDQIQATTVREYLNQTWFASGETLLKVFQWICDGGHGQRCSGKKFSRDT